MSCSHSPITLLIPGLENQCLLQSPASDHTSGRPRAYGVSGDSPLCCTLNKRDSEVSSSLRLVRPRRSLRELFESSLNDESSSASTPPSPSSSSSSSCSSGLSSSCGSLKLSSCSLFGSDEETPVDAADSTSKFTLSVPSEPYRTPNKAQSLIFERTAVQEDLSSTFLRRHNSATVIPRALSGLPAPDLGSPLVSPRISTLTIAEVPLDCEAGTSQEQDSEDDEDSPVPEHEVDSTEPILESPSLHSRLSRRRASMVLMDADNRPRLSKSAIFSITSPPNNTSPLRKRSHEETNLSPVIPVSSCLSISTPADLLNCCSNSSDDENDGDEDTSGEYTEEPSADIPIITCVDADDETGIACLLPTIPGKVSSYNYICPETLVELMQGKFEHLIEDYTIIDCRYSYEYEGGHIEGAKNLFNDAQIEEHFLTSPPAPLRSRAGKRRPVIFHCEFSSKRGPSAYTTLRNGDRRHNLKDYPLVSYPDIYILEGGYKKFFMMFSHLCNPQQYVPMSAKEHIPALRENNKARNRLKRSRSLCLF